MRGDLCTENAHGLDARKQDIGPVFHHGFSDSGVPTTGGNFHCFNDVDGCVFDLTSEQFGDRVLDYSNCPEQDRSVHFAKEEKRQRYEYLREKLLSALDDKNELDAQKQYLWKKLPDASDDKNDIDM